MFDPSDPRNELYSRPPYFKVFISSKMAGGALVDERAAAADAVAEFPLARAWSWERDTPAGSYYSKEECVRQAGTSEAIILIVEDELTPITRAEYAAAHAAGATAIVLLKAGFERPATVDRFISRTQDEAITKPFSNLAELRSAIVGALWTWTVRAGRTVMLETRQQRAHSGGAAVYGDLEILSENGEARYVSDVVEEAREAAAEESLLVALESLYYLADIAATAGLVPVCRALLEEISSIVPAEEIDRNWEGWIANVRGRIESASRRPRAARASFEQMRQIAVSIGDREMEAIAQQNLGVEAAMREDHEAAREHFIASLTIKRDLGDAYGGVQVLLNMAGVLMRRGKLKAAEDILDDCEPLVIRSHMVDLRANIHGQRGLIAAKQGDLKTAKEQFLTSLRWARKTGWVPREISALQNLGKNAIEREKYRESARWFSKALAQALSSNDKHQEQIQRRGLADAYVRLKEWQAAAEQFAAAGAVAAELGDAGAQADALGEAARCLLNAGEAEAALGLINAVLADPAAEKEPAWRSAQLRNLAEVLADLDQPSEALRRLEEAANLATDSQQRDAALQRAAEIALEHPGLAHRAPNFLRRALAIHREEASGAEWAWQAATMGAMLSETSQVAHAAKFFSLALRVFARSGDRQRAFLTRNDRAIVLSRTGELAGAVKDLRVCIRIAEDLEDRSLQFQAQMNLGEIERQRGRLAAAEEHLRKALGVAHDLGDRRNEGAALAIRALVRTEEKRAQDAAGDFERVLEIGRALKDQGLQQSALGGLAGIAYWAGRNAEAERRYRQAIRHYPAEPSIGLAEDLGGCMLAMAARGKVDEEIVQRLVDVSGIVGWDSPCSRELCQAARMMIEVGSAEEAVQLQAAAIGSAVRDLYVWIAGQEDPEEFPTQSLSEVVFVGVGWMHEQEDYSGLKSQLLEELRCFLSLEEDLELVVGAIATAEEVWGEDPSSSKLDL
jgi:tetratricopeptide (TPR) repeat protein